MSAPQLSVITGPVDSGKSRLIKKVLLDLPEKTQQRMAIESINPQHSLLYPLRSSLADILCSSIKSWIEDIRSTLEVTTNETSVCKNHYPIFVIDQANKLKDLLTVKDG